MKNTNPDKLDLCIMLSRGDHAAGVLLRKIHHWSQYSHAKIPGVEGEWRAKEKTWWMREAQMSSGQYNRNIADLLKYELIEKRQYWFGGPSITHVRLSKQTKNFLDAATTWDVALELLDKFGLPIPATHAGTEVNPSLQEMIDAWGAEESLKYEEIGKLALFRESMTSVSGSKGREYDFSGYVVPFIAWTVANWQPLWVKCKIGKKPPKTPQIGFFCENFGAALNPFFKFHDVKPAAPDPDPEPPSFEEPWFEADMEDAC